MSDLDTTPALEMVMAGIALLIAQSAILANPFYTEGEVRKFISIRRLFHREFLEAVLQFADECEAGTWGAGVKGIVQPLRGIGHLTPNQDRQAMLLVVRVLRGVKRAIRWFDDIEPVVLRLIRQVSTIVDTEDMETGSDHREADYVAFFKNVIRVGTVPTGIKVLLRKVILLGKGGSKDPSLGLTPDVNENPGAWFDMGDDEKEAIRNKVNESERIWKEAIGNDAPSEMVRAAWLRSQAILKDAQQKAGVHLNIIKGAEGKEPIEGILKREAKLEVDGPTDFVLTKLREEYTKSVSRDKKNIPREQRKVLNLLLKAKTLDTFQRIIEEAVSRGIFGGAGEVDILGSIKGWTDKLGANKAIRDGIPLTPLNWKPMSIPEFQEEHDTGNVTFPQDMPEEKQQEILGRVSRAISDLEDVFGKGFCGKHEKKLAFQFGEGGGFMAKASYFAWDNGNVWQPRVKFGEDYEGVMAHELSHYLDDLLEYKLEIEDTGSSSAYHANLFGNTGVTLDYMAETLDAGTPHAKKLEKHLPEVKELVDAIVGLPDYTRWKDMLSSGHDMAMGDAVQALTGKSQYDLPRDHPYNHMNTGEAKLKSQLPPELVTESEKQYANMMRGDTRKLSYHYSSVEVWARVCEQYVYYKLAKKGVANPWLNWMAYDGDSYVDEETFEKVLEPILDRLFARLKDRKMLASPARVASVFMESSAFDRYLDEQMKSPSFAAAYRLATDNLCLK